MEGKLWYNPENDRFGLLGADGEWIQDGLHCGDRLAVWIDGRWVPTRVEMTADEIWYLVGLEGMTLQGLRARID